MVPPQEPWRWRTVSVTVCIVVASLLVLVSVVADWTRTLLVDEDRFVQTFAPLATDPVMQEAVADKVSDVVISSVNLDPASDDLLYGLANIGLPSRAVDAVETLRDKARDGLDGAVQQTTEDLVRSDAFAALWEQTLRASHQALVASATGGTAHGAIRIDEAGIVTVDLGPVIESVKSELVDRHVVFAAFIPEVDAEIDLLQSDTLVVISWVYALAIAVGAWLPIVPIVLFAAAVALARQRSSALLGIGVGVAVSAIVLIGGIEIVRALLAASASAHDFSAGAVTAVYRQITAAMTKTATVLAVLGTIMAAVAWLCGRWGPARTVRARIRQACLFLRRSTARA